MRVDTAMWSMSLMNNYGCPNCLLSVYHTYLVPVVVVIANPPPHACNTVVHDRHIQVANICMRVFTHMRY